MELISSYFIALWDYVILTAPYLILGMLASGLLHEFMDMEFMRRHLSGKGLKPIFKAAAFGVPLPLCSCSVIPAAVTLKKQGASNGATSSFLISTPESGIDSIVMTYGVMDLPMTILRPVAAFFTAMVAGLGQNFFNNEKASKFSKVDKEANSILESESCCDSTSTPKAKRSFMASLKSILNFSFKDLSDDLSFWLIIGLMVGAAMNLLIPDDLFSQIPDWGERLIVLAFGVPFYICASASTPIAASMMMKGMSPGTALIFLLVGPATNFTNIAVLQKFIGKKGVVINVLAIALVALGMSFIVDYLYAAFSWPLIFKIEKMHEHSASYFEHGMAIFLSLLLIKGLWVENIRPKFKKDESKACCG